MPPRGNFWHRRRQEPPTIAPPLPTNAYHVCFILCVPDTNSALGFLPVLARPVYSLPTSPKCFASPKQGWGAPEAFRGDWRKISFGSAVTVARRPGFSGVCTLGTCPERLKQFLIRHLYLKSERRMLLFSRTSISSLRLEINHPYRRHHNAVSFPRKIYQGLKRLAKDLAAFPFGFQGQIFCSYYQLSDRD